MDVDSRDEETRQADALALGIMLLIDAGLVAHARVLLGMAEQGRVLLRLSERYRIALGLAAKVE
jgi:hypothetical protein